MFRSPLSEFSGSARIVHSSVSSWSSTESTVDNRSITTALSTRRGLGTDNGQRNDVLRDVGIPGYETNFRVNFQTNWDGSRSQWELFSQAMGLPNLFLFLPPCIVPKKKKKKKREKLLCSWLLLKVGLADYLSFTIYLY